MSLATNLQNAFTRVATEFKAIRTLVSGSGTGDTSGLTTTSSNLVGAINEVKALVGAGSPTTLDDLTDVSITLAANGDVLQFDGTSWVDATLAAVAISGDAGDLTGTLPTSVLPPLAVNETFVVADQAAMLALTAERGDMAIRTDTGKTYVLSTDSPGTLADWKEVLATGQVQSVNGQTGVVVLTKSDVGLTNVTNVAQQPLDATLTALAALSTSADQMIYSTGADAFALATLSSFARTLLDDADAATARGTLSVYSQAEIGDPTTDFVATFEAGLL